MAIRPPAMTLDLDLTYVMVLALFSVPLVVLNLLVFRPFLKLFADRHERLEGALARAEAMLAKSEQQAKAFEAKIQAATSQGLEARNRLRSEAAEEMTRRLVGERARVRQEVEAKVLEIHEFTAGALQRAREQAQELATATAAKLLGRGI